jgi:hypothetical protein
MKPVPVSIAALRPRLTTAAARETPLDKEEP